MKITFHPSALKQSRFYELLLRFFFGGLITVIAALIAKKFGPVVGGLFLAFPAIFPSSATLIEKHEREKKAKHGLHGLLRGRLAAGVDAAGAALGALGLISFALIVWQLLPRFALWLTLLLAILAWATISVVAWRLYKSL